VNSDELYLAVSVVEPTLIRVDADEVTYNLHIILRVGLEREMIAGRLNPRDLPEAWNARFQEDMGITPPSPDVGVLQDIHWAAGHIGYFATYSLGNVYASQFYEAARRAVPDLESRIRKGDLITLREWLMENVHRWGRRYPALELIERATGRPPVLDDFKDYVAAKFGALYGIEVGVR
jgi:carboxypeptidase Taq